MKSILIGAITGLVVSVSIWAISHHNNKLPTAPDLLFCGTWKTPEIFIDANHTPVITFKSLDGKVTLYTTGVVDWNIGNCASG